MSHSLAEIDPLSVMRELSHERIHRLWQAAKHATPLEGDDAQLVQAMRDHPAYHEVWDHANEFLQEQVAVEGANPFLHVVMHQVVENQAAQNNPPEVRAVLEFKTSHGTTRHEAVHAIASEFAQSLWQALHDREAFDNDAYRRKLDKLLPRSRHKRK